MASSSHPTLFPCHTLAQYCLQAVVKYLIPGAADKQLCYPPPNLLLDQIPATALVDILHHVATTIDNNDADLERLRSYLVPLFPILLINARGKRPQLLQLFKSAIDKEFLSIKPEDFDDDYDDYICPPHLPQMLAMDFIHGHNKATTLRQELPPSSLSRPTPKDGLALGEFLMDSGWFYEAQLVLDHTLSHSHPPLLDIQQQLFVLEKFVLAQSYYNMVKEARSSCDALTNLIQEVKSCPTLFQSTNLAPALNAISIHHYSENRYDQALRWSIAALNELERRRRQILSKQVDSSTTSTSHCSCCSSCSPSWAVTVIDVLRQASTCCSVKRELTKAELLITSAVSLARGVFGPKSVKYGDTLADYGFYLISSDNIRRGVEMYEEALAIRREAFGNYNIFTALSLTELSYSLYVLEYNTGRFEVARRCAEEAMNVAGRLLPPSHLLHASSSRVLALILEEIAIDNVGSPAEEKLLGEAESLHTSCLRLTLSVFGEMNVQTAKHYGNLGRLYQTMKKYGDAESHHLKAISIKEKLLGEWDYEVALSVGHLASLYNYDLHLFHKAEALHLRSISIGQRLFGESYSGLEYDYRGLLQVYLMTGREEKYGEYANALARWKALQDLKSADAAAQIQGRGIQGTQSGSKRGVSGQFQPLEPLEITLDKFKKLMWARWTDDEMEELDDQQTLLES